MEKEFNQQKYIQQYNKEHYKAFKVDLKKDELDHINELLRIHNLSKAEFLRLSIKALEMNKIKKDL